jgi:hypothetical protein
MVADTRKSVTVRDAAGHTTWLAAVAEAYPRFHGLLVTGWPLVITNADWLTLSSVEGFIDGSPIGAALTAVSAGTCDFDRIIVRPHSNFPTLH